MKAKSQWEFGELFPQETFRRVWTVGELTTKIRALLEQQIGEAWVSGEITNLRAQASGHVYFTIKDATAQLNCVLFRGEAARQQAGLQEGQKVILQGELTVYEPRGQYQLRVTKIELQGIGALQAAFEKLKQKLAAAGWFAPERKRPLPPFPRRIGVVTSPTGAALRDVARAIQRRHPGLEIILAPCKVQGVGAADEIAAAIRQLNHWQAAHGNDPSRQLDAILITRGGGSLEDLWAFNEEIVAQAIFESELPVVSAVGHEIDFTISDWVADVRAATPTAGAEILTENVYTRRAFVAGVPLRLAQLLRRWLEQEEQHWQRLARALDRAHPRRKINEHWQHLDDLRLRLARETRQQWRGHHAQWDNARQRLGRIRWPQEIAHRRQAWQTADRHWRELAQNRLRLIRQQWQTAQSQLEMLAPNRVLARGYSITRDAATGRIVQTAEEVKPGQQLATELKSGTIKSVVSAGHPNLS